MVAASRGEYISIVLPCLIYLVTSSNETCTQYREISLIEEPRPTRPIMANISIAGANTGPAFTAPVPPWDMQFLPSKTTTCIIVFILTSFHYLHRLIRIILKKRRFEAFGRAHTCLTVPHAANPFPMPWSLNRKYEVYKASIRGDLFEGHFSRVYRRYGNTHAIVSPFTHSQKGINTIEPANIQTVLATRFNDYKRPEFRSLAAQPMLLPGLFTTDGPVWAHWRGMVRPQFTRRRFDANLADSERHMQLVFTALGEPGLEGWTEDVDLLVSTQPRKPSGMMRTVSYI